jgi:Ser/Thr protein kinase RdoA (MazF antagonist)
VSEILDLKSSICRDYGLHVNDMTCVINGLNKVYCLDSSEGTFYLKVYRPFGRSRQAIQFEHSIINNLGAAVSTEFSVAAPLNSLAGESIQETTFAERLRLYAVFQEARGRLPTFDPEDAYVVGKAVASMHQSMRQLPLPPSRPNLTGDLIRNSLLELGDVGELTENFRRTIAAAGNKALEAVDKSLPSTGFFIHGDVCNLNCRLDEATVTFFDFDECGWGSQLYDMAGWVFSAIASLDDPKGLRTSIDAYLGGYNTENRLEEQDVSLLPYLSIAHLLRTLAYLASNRLIPAGYWRTVEEKSRVTLSRIFRGFHD